MIEPGPYPNAVLSRERERIVVARTHPDFGVDEVGGGKRDGGELVDAVGDVVRLTAELLEVAGTHIRFVGHRLVVDLSGKVHQEPDIGRVVPSRENRR